MSSVCRLSLGGACLADLETRFPRLLYVQIVIDLSMGFDVLRRWHGYDAARRNRLSYQSNVEQTTNEETRVQDQPLFFYLFFCEA